MSLPSTYTDKNETGCCSVPNVDAWDRQKVTFEDRHFIRMYTKSFFFMPLNMANIMKALNDMAESSSASLPTEQAMILSRDLSPWKAEQLYGVNKPIEGADNVTLNGTYLTQVFEGPYENAKNWYQEMIDYAKQSGYKPGKTYFFYTTCPKCAKHYGKNYVVGLIEITE
jgi:hypothetical protein